jgi:hypothetical protein
MPFFQLVNAQQIEVVVTGPGDVTRLYICKGIAQGNFNFRVIAGQSLQQTDTWQFEVGPNLDSTQFRRAIANVALAGIGEVQPANLNWSITAVSADFDDDAGLVRVTATNSIEGAAGTVNEFAGVTALAYDVSILAAITGG